jgi:RNA polymerase sigma-70 factor (ECF subfamily)
MVPAEKGCGTNRMATEHPSPPEARRPKASMAEFEAFYDRTCRPAYGLALELTADARAASSACERAYLEAWREARFGAEDQQRLSLLDGIRRAALGGRELQQGPPAPGNAPMSHGEGVDIREGLEQVGELGRRVIELAYFGGLQVPEIAELVGEPVGNVRTAMREALLQLAVLTRGRTEALR